MANDATRITIQFPDMDYDGDGTVDATSAFTPCVFEGPNWSGFTKPETETTCSSDSLNDWGNLVRTYAPGTIIDFGQIAPVVDWAIDTTDGGKVFGAFQSRVTGNFLVNLPADVGETTGPVITIPGVVTGFNPRGTILGEGDEARFAAEVVIKISGQPTFAIAT